MKILIMVLTYMEPPYDELYKNQLATWDSIPEQDVHTLYYHGGADNVQCDLLRQHHKSTSTLIQTEDTNSYYYMAAKFQSALRYALLSKFDIIFRTNSSSYINKKKLKEFAETLPKEKLYAGWEIEGNGYNVVSGAGFFLSRDTAQILCDKIDPNFEREEDVYCAQLLHDAGIKIINDKSRYDVESYFSEVPTDRYHYRFKTGDRLLDAKNMQTVHKLINP